VAGFYRGTFIPRNPKKYRGDISQIVYRSSWEAALMYWLDINDKVKAWSSENVIVPYVSPIDNKVHRYFIDFMIETTEGVFLVEVKPQKECMPPKRRQGKRKHLIEAEARTYAQNTAKWQAAEQYAHSMGYKFQVWDEITLKKLGVVI
jgi:hypothetical protein